MQNLLAKPNNLPLNEKMEEPKNLPPFKIDINRMNEQLSHLLDVLYNSGESFNITAVRLLTPDYSLTRKGITHVEEARDVRIFERDSATGNLKRSHHHIGNNLQVANYRGKLRIVTTHSGVENCYDLELQPSSDKATDAASPQVTENTQSASDADQSIDLFMKSLRTAVQTPQRKSQPQRYGRNFGNDGLNDLTPFADLLGKLDFFPTHPENKDDRKSGGFQPSFG